MANESEQAAPAGEKLLTLTEVRKRTGISMPTLQKYKKRYPQRIPSTGKGRAQRYPESALAVFGQLRDENLSRRGRPRKAVAGDGAAKGGTKAGTKAGVKAGAKAGAKAGTKTGTKRGAKRRAPAKATRAQAARPSKRRAAKSKATRTAASKASASGALTLREVARRVGISYPTALRYVKNSLNQLPHIGSGRARRFKEEAVEVFARLRGESRPGRKPGSGKGKGAAQRKGARKGAKRATGARRGRPPGTGVGAAVQSLLRRVEQRLKRVEEQLKRPFRIEVRR